MLPLKLCWAVSASGPRLWGGPIHTLLAPRAALLEAENPACCLMSSKKLPPFGSILPSASRYLCAIGAQCKFAEGLNLGFMYVVNGGAGGELVRKTRPRGTLSPSLTPIRLVWPRREKLGSWEMLIELLRHISALTENEVSSEQVGPLF